MKGKEGAFFLWGKERHIEIEAKVMHKGIFQLHNPHRKRAPILPTLLYLRVVVDSYRTQKIRSLLIKIDSLTS